MAGKSRKKSAFLRKDVKANAPKVIGRSVARAGGAIAAAGVSNRVFGGPDAAVKDLGKAAGAVPFILGVAIELMIEDDYLQAVGEGMSAYGAIHLTGQNAPENITQQLGLNGLGQVPSYADYYEVEDGPYNPYSGQPAMSGLAGDVDDLIAELDAAAEAEGMQGLGMMEALSDLPMIQ